MTFLELLQKKFFPKRYQEKQALKKEEALQAQRFDDGNDFQSQEQEPYQEVGIADSAANQSASAAFQRSKSRETAPKKQPVWLQKLEAILPSPQNPIRRFWRRYHIGKILVILIGTLVLLLGSYLFYLSKTAKVSDLQDALKATTVIYDHTGEYAGSLSGQKGTYVELDAISDDLENAVIATEDRTFYSNNGINLKRFLLAVVTAGRFGGGSTITQQLAKNAYLSQDQTIKRKAREFFLALELTKKYSKKDILTMYLNNSYFGNGVWGVEDASQKYFGTTAANLTLDEAATLAGMLKGPEIYNPYYSLENATNRRDTVLGAMVDAGKINQDQAAEAKTVGMGNRLADTYVGKSDDYQYPSYFDAVINEAISTYGISEKDIVNNGYKVYTELDQNYQTGMQTTFNNDNLFPVSAYDGSSAQAASVALDPKTGAVRGLIGRVNSSENPTFRSFNYATQAQRSPASAIKPLVVYAPAVASGWSVEKELPNTIQDFDGYQPHNYGNYESEDVPMYQALANSYNIPAVSTLNDIGIDKAFAYGKKFGLDMTSAKKELGVALGGSVTTNPLEMAQAYAAFANNGVIHPAHLITRIENARGEVVKAFTDRAKRVISQSVADKMTSMMLGTFSNGTAVNANVYGYTLAGKTGTTETSFNPDVAGDQWVIGYTPDVVISQWVGFNQTDENHYLTDSSAGTASTIFSTQASYILPYTKGSQFHVDNAYAQNGIAAVYGINETGNQTGIDSQSIIDGLRKSAEEASKSLSDAVDQSGLRDKAQSIWNGIVDYFR
ncbi:penicillin-binding protein PBP2A [Streptococcus dysgalactiae]|uniref:Penicillin-binding protein PBP2A n=1 Tax=Streptococcus dysgalactiae subsp. equisimilis TaxID=119602 RepID=A0AB38Y0T8_STREQ|nr:penicillin-binding protein PBP2A [Streptococcus dysgalactiae]QQY17626.1 penicillin-binding protein PBP2A [Streptococcus dysgalactiae]TYK95399.1 penicillin-binding protein [Streptococcus dysgalactiae]WEQ81359.1 multimodular transpeptidase-transglycosylase penicillin-binding protein Pbp2A [Streptococcus dysgalactiae subsp. equisimilis]WHM79081.1 penicillin-binding protein PBP2A [Streptococcus dysgalactiae subsp. equisimilis]WJD52169.1 penicillin-binding protein PBP2A [Streptococcus dysgalacti